MIESSIAMTETPMKSESTIADSTNRQKIADSRKDAGLTNPDDSATDLLRA